MNCFSPSEDMGSTVVQICQMTFFAVYSVILYTAILSIVIGIAACIRYRREMGAAAFNCWRRVPSFYNR